MLTSAQKTTLKNHLAANTNTVVVGGTTFPINSDDVMPANHAAPSDEAAGKVAAFYNNVSAPDYWTLKDQLSRHELTDVTGTDSDGVTPTNFTWGGVSGGYINRSQGERDAFGAIFNASDNINPTRANVRTAIDDIFSGNGAGAVANRTQFRAVSRRKSKIGEKLFAVQTVGGPSQAGARGSATNPDTPGFDNDGNSIQNLSPQDIKDAWTS